MTGNIPCRKSKVQEYECQVSSGGISFDACLAKELFYLWDNGIETTGCCCGRHSNCHKSMAYIGVKFKHIDKMKSWGYRVAVNPMRPNDEDSFIPKTFEAIANGEANDV